ncbi:hypothetical protein [Nonomuraea bangladeshensis]|uniref:hypothetical protein n=1 Tax=Nonomuraea bangladeshensis TaxID=404385 RepID=UPI003C2F8878
MSVTTAATTRYIRTVWRGKKSWNWIALYVGHVQPRGYRTYFRHKRLWQFHLTPIHASRDGIKWTVGLCWGRRTIYLFKHS